MCKINVGQKLQTLAQPSPMSIFTPSINLWAMLHAIYKPYFIIYFVINSCLVPSCGFSVANMSFPNREDRNKCWGARDEYWKCLDKVGVTEAKKGGPCAELRELYENACSSQWVKHFDRKRSYLKFKERIEKEGYEPLDDKDA